MGNYLYKKIVDKSLLSTGMTIPMENYQKILEELKIDLNKGDRQYITIKIADQKYDATITCDNYHSNRNVIQIRYGAKSPICQALNTIFAYSAGKIAQRKAEASEGKKQLSVEEYIDVYSAGERALEFVCHTKNSETPLRVEKDLKIRPIVEQLLNQYIKSKQEVFAGHAIGNYIRVDAPEALYDTGLIDRQKYLIKGSVGQGDWVTVPWIGIFDKEITTTATKGIYIVYLLSADGDSLYLTFNQGCTETRKMNSKKDTIKIMRERAKEITSRIDSRGFATDENINLGEGLTELGEMYQKGTIFYKKYTKGNVPDEAELREDLSKMMDIYREYAEGKTELPLEDKEDGKTELPLEDEKDGKTKMPSEDIEDIGEIGDMEPQEDEVDLDTKGIISGIKRYIESKGFYYNDGLIENFYLSLKSKPFVILAGTSGTGKTRLVKLFAEAVGATSAESGGNGHYKLVAVRPDWSDSSDLFGHTNLKGEFVPGAIIDFVKEASKHLKEPYFLCLDEMNLARVEYYLSDFLSVIETRRHVGDRIETDQIILDKAAEEDYGKLTLPENLYIVGTVNMDETTFPFSKKVLDRANTIEFSHVDLEPEFDLAEEEISPVPQGNGFLKTEYLVLKTDIKKEQQELAADVCGKLQEINKILQEANAHVGYRVRDEIVFYMLNNAEADLLEENEALDNEIMQKILPRIQGSSVAVKELLCKLFQKFAGDYSGLDQSFIWKQMETFIHSKECVYKNSAEKICYMMRRYEEDGFTSYWI